MATKKNYLSIIRLLLDNGWSIENPGEKETLLHIAAEKNSVSLIKFFLEKGANIDAKNGEGYTPLLTAAAHNNLEAVEIFHGLKLLPQLSSYGETILSVALKHDSINVVNYLVMKCLSDNELMNSIFYRPNNVGDTPLHIAAAMNHFETFNASLITSIFT
uniref:Ankyrin repeat protein n=1 Tax=Panagrolaimus davidi TaxID=227884 RepID=A0A914QX34_9BILA